MGKNLKRRDFLKLLTAGLAETTMLTACNNNLSATSSLTSATTASKTVSSNNKITLTWWDYYQGTSTNDLASAVLVPLKSYMAAHPNVTIERTPVSFTNMKERLVLAQANNDLPDIVVVDNPDHQALAAQGILQDITSLVNSWGQASQYFSGPWNSTLYQGKNYGLPFTTNCLALWYNTELLSTPPKTWEELKTQAKALTTANRFGFAVSADKSEESTFQWLPFLWQAGGDIPNIFNENGKAALQLWVDMVQNGSMSHDILHWEQADVNTQFEKKQAAMIVNGSWEISIINHDVPNMKWKVALLPQGKTQATSIGGENIAITKSCKNIAVAWDVLTWFQTPESFWNSFKIYSSLPTRKDFATDPQFKNDPVLSLFVEQLKVGRPRAYGPNYPQISAAVQEAIQSAVSGLTSVDAALAQAQATITPLLKS